MLRLIALMFMSLMLLSGGCSDRNGAHKSSGESIVLKRVPTKMTISTRNGDVSVVADSTLDAVSVMWTAHLEAGAQSHADYRAGLATLRQQWSRDNHVLLEAAFPGADHPADGMDVIIHVPDLDGLTIETSNGHVTTLGTQGLLTIHNRQGAISITSHSGNARLISSNGSIIVNGQAGDLIVRTSNGLVHVEKLAGQPNIRATNAGIRLELQADQPGPVFLQTSNAPIVLQVGPQFGGTILAETTNASIELSDSADVVLRVADGPSTKRITMSKSGEASHVKTTNAEIECSVVAPSSE